MTNEVVKAIREVGNQLVEREEKNVEREEKNVERYASLVQNQTDQLVMVQKEMEKVRVRPTLRLPDLRITPKSQVGNFKT